MSAARRVPQVVGWREWIRLPDLDVDSIKAKVDTGARTSSLHAFDIEEFRRNKKDYVRFGLHPEQRSSRHTVDCVARMVDRRDVKASSGHVQSRPVIITTMELLGQVWEVEFTLTSRDEMGFRMLLGRQALRSRFIVDPGTSFRNGRRVKGTKRLKRTKPR